MSLTKDEEKWDMIVSPKNSLLELNLRETWKYRDLIRMNIKRDVITVYKQTVLGPLWYVVQPILTTLIYMVVFGGIAQISTDGLPQALFYLSGIVIWNYFADCFHGTSHTFRANAGIFGKVYFPRIVMPLSKVISGLIKFGIQLGFLVLVYVYFLWEGFEIYPTYALAYFPLFIFIAGGVGMGTGLITSALTAKYRDLSFLLHFGIQLLMYATPVIYPISTVPEKYRVFILANPLTSVVEGARYALLGTGSFDLERLMYSLAFTLIILFLGVVVFNKAEKDFIDTV